MPISGYIDGAILCTSLTGTIGDGELVSYYKKQITLYHHQPWYELTDGTGVIAMTLSMNDLEDFQRFVGQRMDIMHGGRVAMVASSDLVYGMFRMWELIRSDLDYEVKVFRDVAKAREWLVSAYNLHELNEL